MPLHVFQTTFRLRILRKGDVKVWYSMCPWKSHSLFIIGLPSPSKVEVDMVLGKGKWQMYKEDTILHMTVLTSYSEARVLHLFNGF